MSTFYTLQGVEYLWLIGVDSFQQQPTGFRKLSQSPDRALTKLWEAATPAKDVRHKLAPPDLADRFQKSEPVDLMQAFSAQFLKADAHKGGLAAIARAVEATKPAMSEKWETLRALDAHLLAQLRSGQLRAIGYEFPRSIHSAPVELRPEHWTAVPDWDKGEFKANGLHLVELRFAPAPPDTDVADNLVATSARPGRPSVKQDIADAFDALREAGEIDPTASQQSHYPKVRAWLKRRNTDLSVPATKISDKTLQRHFSPFFNDLKDSSKL